MQSAIFNGTSGDTDCEDFFIINMDSTGHGFTKKDHKNNRRQFCKNTNLFQFMQTVFVSLFVYSLFSFRILTFNELKVVVKECQLPMILVLTHNQSETKKHVIGVFLSVEGNETSHLVNGMYSKCITNPFISDIFTDVMVTAVNFHMLIKFFGHLK